ncbi:MAG: DUF177 domain-containing protein [Bacilli bacterium]|nr:DUF177 domain-containing protein [Bacilli bacterium]
MEFDLKRLLNNIDKEILIDKTYSFDKEELKGTDIINLDNVSIKGNITKNNLNNLIINLEIKGIMVLPCSLTLVPVDYPFDINVDGNLEEMLEDLEEIDKKIENSLDILPIIWENILMEIPSKVVSPDAKDIELSGDGWKLIKEEEKRENPELAKLKDLL